MRRARHRSRLALGALVLASAMTLGACATSSGPAETAAPSSESGGTLIIGGTFSDLPTMDIVPSQGLEGQRFIGFQLYDGLVRFDPLNADAIVPGLAESWEVDGTTWTFHLREGVTFHDGTEWNADAAIFNFDRMLDEDFEHYSPEMSSLNARRTRSIDTYSKIDDYTIEITTAAVDGFMIYELPYVSFASPAAIIEWGADYAKHPVGTGPFRFAELVERQHIVLEPNLEYWDEPAKLDQVVIRAMPEPAARYAGLRSGEISWAEVPPPDAVDEMTASGIQIVTGPYGHIWFYQPNMAIPPFDDQRVREAFLLAVDKVSLCEDLLNGACQPGNGPIVPVQKDWYPTDAKTYDYDPERARELLAEAGYPDGIDVKIQMPSGGSGNMWPLPMAEFIQMNLAEAGIKVDFEVLDWATISETLRGEFPEGVNAIEMSRGIRSPGEIERNFITPIPSGSNNMGYDSPELKALSEQMKVTQDIDEQNDLMRQAAKILHDETVYLVVVHDLNMRALAPGVHGFQPPSSWFIDLRSVWVED